MRRTCTDYAVWFIFITGIISIFNILEHPASPLITVIGCYCILAFLAPGRLKDMDINPWWAILTILPFIGLILMFPKGTPGENQYGANPRLT